MALPSVTLHSVHREVVSGEVPRNYLVEKGGRFLHQHISFAETLGCPSTDVHVGIVRDLRRHVGRPTVPILHLIRCGATADQEWERPFYERVTLHAVGEVIHRVEDVNDISLTLTPGWLLSLVRR